MGQARSVYVWGGASNFAPHPLWTALNTWKESQLLQALEQGELEPLYGTALLFNGFEALAGKARMLGLELEQVGSIELGLAYPRELCGLSEAEVLEDFQRRLQASAFGPALRKALIRFRPTISASSGGMVPFNDALGTVLETGKPALVITAGNVKGTRPGRLRLSPAESTPILANLISPLDRRLTGATMLKLTALLLARACQQDLDLLPALAKHVREVRLSVHRHALAGADPVHISLPPDRIADRVVASPMRLMGVAPQSMGWAGLILGPEAPEAPRVVQVLGAGAGVDSGSLRLRADPMASQAMMKAMDTALQQAKLADGQRLWLFEAHNAFPGVFLAELRRVLELRGETASVAECLLSDRAGALGQPLLVSPAGGTLAGHPIAATTVRLLGETAKQLVAGHPAGLHTGEGVSYGAVSAVGGPHCFDGFFLLGVGKAADLQSLASDLAPFDHDRLQGVVLADQSAESSETEVQVRNPVNLLHIAWTDPERAKDQDHLALAVDAEGRLYPCRLERTCLDRLPRHFVGLPTRLDSRLRVQALGWDALGHAEETHGTRLEQS